MDSIAPHSEESPSPADSLHLPFDDSVHVPLPEPQEPSIEPETPTMAHTVAETGKARIEQAAQPDEALTAASVYSRTAQKSLPPNCLDLCSSVGQMLNTARVALGLSFEEVEAASKIRKAYLQALEQNNFAALPAKAYVSASVKLLGKVYRMTADELNVVMNKLSEVEGYGDTIHVDPETCMHRVDAHGDTHDNRFPNAEVTVTEQKHKWVMLAALILVFAGIIGCSIYLLAKLINPSKNTEAQPTVGEERVFTDADYADLEENPPTLENTYFSAGRP